MEKAAKRNRENNDDNDDDSLDVSAVSASEQPKALQGHNAFDRSSHWNTPKKRRVRKKPIDVYVTTMNSPASTIDSPITTAARATKVDSDSNSDSNEEECLQTFAVKLVVIPFFGTIIRC